MVYRDKLWIEEINFKSKCTRSLSRATALHINVRSLNNTYTSWNH